MPSPISDSFNSETLNRLEEHSKQFQQNAKSKSSSQTCSNRVGITLVVAAALIMIGVAALAIHSHGGFQIAGEWIKGTALPAMQNLTPITGMLYIGIPVLALTSLGCLVYSCVRYCKTSSTKKTQPPASNPPSPPSSQPNSTQSSRQPTSQPFSTPELSPDSTPAQSHTVSPVGSQAPSPQPPANEPLTQPVQPTAHVVPKQTPSRFQPTAYVIPKPTSLGFQPTKAQAVPKPTTPQPTPPASVEPNPAPSPESSPATSPVPEDLRKLVEDLPPLRFDSLKKTRKERLKNTVTNRTAKVRAAATKRKEGLRTLFSRRNK